MSETNPLRRKIGAIRHNAPPLPSAERVWRRAIVHGLSRGLGLSVEAERPSRAQIQPEAASALMTEGTLAVLLEGSAGPGVMLVEIGPLTAMVEQLTIGRIGKRPPRVRPPSTTDAALVADPIDRILSTHEGMISELHLKGAVTGFRFGTRLQRPRDIALALPDDTHEHWAAPVSFPGTEGRSGMVHLILPTELAAKAAADVHSTGPKWSEKIENRVLSSEVVLSAELARIGLTASELRALRPGARLTLPREQVGHVELMGPGGVSLAKGRLGQSAGRKAVRIELPEEDTTFHLAGPDGMMM